MNEHVLFSTTTAVRYFHEGQTDWTGVPYVNHVIAVMDLLPEDSPVERKQIALLHDVIEDCWEVIFDRIGGDRPTELTKDVALRAAEYLRTHLDLSQHVIDGIMLVTRIPGEMTYIEKIRALVESGHVDAMWVKLCDNRHNTDPSRYERLSPERLKIAEEMRPRYERSMKILRAALGLS